MTKYILSVILALVVVSLTAQGIEGQNAADWDIEQWIDGDGKSANFSIDDFKGKKIVLFCFQSWCPGCHKTGFPMMQYLAKRFENDEDVVTLAIQTVFEGTSVNTFNKLKKMQKKYKLKIPFGHDIGAEDGSNIVNRYKTGGTPWFIIIDVDGTVIYNYFDITLPTAMKLLL